MGPCSDGGSTSVLFALVTALLCYSAQSCKVQLCSRQYARALEEQSVIKGPTYVYCTILHSYTECMRLTSRSCRGDLNYHSMKSLVVQWNKSFNCSAIIEQGPQPELTGYNYNKPGHRFQRPRPSASAECSSYKPAGGSPVAFSHCGLFGDPHLRTFYNELQTCTTMGAWPLIDNPHMAVQVTNDAVSKGSKATATTKITVIIRQHGPCATEKTYEAQTDSLPGVFLDGSKSSGPGVRIREENPGRHIEIHLRYIGTRIVIRQVGHYLTFAVRMPQEIAIQGAQTDGLELCLRGCPKNQRINFSQILSQPDEILSMVASSGHVTMLKKEAVSTCKNYNITGFYFEACVFDLLTTGDSTFSMAAHDAMLDVMALSPSAVSSLQNRTIVSDNGGTIVPRGVMIPENCAPGRPCSFIVLFVMLWLLVIANR